MTDLSTLTEAFAELERHADALPLRTDEPTTLRTAQPPRRQHAALVAASVVGVAAVAGGAVLLAGTGDDHRRTPAGGPSASTSGAPASSAPVAPASSSAPRTAGPYPKPSSTGATPSSSAPNGPEPSGLPASTEPGGGSVGPTALSDQLLALLGPSAAVTVTDAGSDPANPNIVGVLTVHGHRGGFDLQTYDAGRHSTASCDDPDRSRCTVHRYSDGSSLALGSEPLRNVKGGVTFQAQFVRANGRSALMHVSNERDPKGESAKLSVTPPLTTAQVASIVRSPKIFAAR
jgi:hypothetical protein